MEQKAGAQISLKIVLFGILLFILVVIGCNDQGRVQGYNINP